MPEEHQYRRNTMEKKDVYEMWLVLTLRAEKEGNQRMVDYCLERISVFGLMG